MDAINPSQQSGETVGFTPEFRLPELDPVPQVEPAPGGEAPRAVLFVADDVETNDLLDGVEIVRVNKDVIADQIQRRT